MTVKQLNHTIVRQILFSSSYRNFGAEIHQMYDLDSGSIEPLSTKNVLQNLV